MTANPCQYWVSWREYELSPHRSLIQIKAKGSKSGQVPVAKMVRLYSRETVTEQGCFASIISFSTNIFSTAPVALTSSSAPLEGAEL